MLRRLARSRITNTSIPEEIARILKKGGTLIITDCDEHAFTFCLEEQADLWMGFKRDEINAWFAEVGLRDITVDTTRERCCAPSKSTDNCADISIFIARGTK